MAFRFVALFLMILVLANVFGALRLGIRKLPEGRCVFGIFLSHIGCEFRPTGRAAGFHLFGFLLGKR